MPAGAYVKMEDCSYGCSIGDEEVTEDQNESGRHCNGRSCSSGFVCPFAPTSQIAVDLLGYFEIQVIDQWNGVVNNESN